MATQQQKNKELVLRAMQICFGDKKVEEIDNYFHEDYIEHDPHFPDGAEFLRNLVKNDKAPTQKLDIKRAAADGDLVWVHFKGHFLGKDMVVIDIFRVENGKIKEHWGLFEDMELKEPSKNPHPFF